MKVETEAQLKSLLCFVSIENAHLYIKISVRLFKVKGIRHQKQKVYYQVKKEEKKTYFII